MKETDEIQQNQEADSSIHGSSAESDLSTVKCHPIKVKLIDSSGKLIDPVAKIPVIAQYKRINERGKLLDETCDLFKVWSNSDLFVI